MTATKRKTISKTTRFEVFKRDGFKCVYCGACAPEAVLVVDHIDPLAKGGENEVVNYATACQPCNAGKSDRKLDDNSVLQRQRRQLEELSQRREQLEMMLEWRNALKGEKDAEVEVVADAWSDAAPGWSLNEKGLKEAKALVKKHGLSAVLDAIEVAAESYIKRDASNDVTSESAGVAWKKVGGILTLQALPEAQRRLYYVQGILRNRLSYVSPYAIRLMQEALKAGVDVGDIEAEAKITRNWTGFNEWLNAESGQ